MCLGPLPVTPKAGPDGHRLSLAKQLSRGSEDESFEDFLTSRGLEGFSHKSIFPLATLPKSKGGLPRNGVVSELKGMFEPHSHTFHGDPRHGPRKYSEQITAASFSSNGDSLLQTGEEKAPTLPPKLRKGSAPMKATPTAVASTTTSESLAAYLDILSSLNDLPPTEQPFADLSSTSSASHSETLISEQDDDEEVKPALPPKQSRVKVAVKNYLASTLPRKKERQKEMHKGDRPMSLAELESYIHDKGKRGLALEYLTLREEPQQGTFDKFK